ncbi:MAG TPA: hypothetical protein PLJ74_05320 [Myxococcota bacterium]|nr:hypothetical protein [Myxococcota bacterium]
MFGLIWKSTHQDILAALVSAHLQDLKELHERYKRREGEVLKPEPREELEARLTRIEGELKATHELVMALSKQLLPR